LSDGLCRRLFGLVMAIPDARTVKNADTN